MLVEAVADIVEDFLVGGELDLRAAENAASMASCGQVAAVTSCTGLAALAAGRLTIQVTAPA